MQKLVELLRSFSAGPVVFNIHVTVEVLLQTWTHSHWRGFNNPADLMNCVWACIMDFEKLLMPARRAELMFMDSVGSYVPVDFCFTLPLIETWTFKECNKLREKLWNLIRTLVFGHYILGHFWTFKMWTWSFHCLAWSHHGTVHLLKRLKGDSMANSQKRTNTDPLLTKSTPEITSCLLTILHTQTKPRPFLCLHWLDPCCLDTVHIDVRWAIVETVRIQVFNGTRIWLIPLF